MTSRIQKIRQGKPVITNTFKKNGKTYNTIKYQENKTTRYASVLKDSKNFESIFKKVGQSNVVYSPKEIRPSKKFKIQNFRNKNVTDLNTLANAIVKKSKEFGNYFTSFTIRGTDSDGNLIYRTIKTSQIKNRKGIKELVEAISFNHSEDIHGSDAYAEIDAIDPTFFRMDKWKAKAGADIPEPKHKNRKIKNVVIDSLLCQNFPSKNENCIIEIFRNVSNQMTKTANEIRQALNIEKGQIEIDEIYKLEKYFNKKVCVVVGSETISTVVEKGEKEDLSKANIMLFKTNIDYIDESMYGDMEDCDFAMFLRNGHVSLIKKRCDKYHCPISGIAVTKKGKTAPLHEIRKLFIAKGYLIVPEKKKKKKEIKGKKEKRYFTFDYETTYDTFGFLKPYSVACIKERIEEYWKGGECYEEKIKEAEFFDLSEKCNENFYDWLFDNRDYEHDNILLGYNSAKFDNYLLMEELIKNESLSSRSVFLAGNSLLKVEFDSFRTLDLCKFLMLPLKKACEDFGCELQKGVLDHTEIQELYFKDKDNFFNNMKKHEEEIKKYNILDCAALSELFFKIKKCAQDLLNEELEDNVTLAGMGYNSWNKHPHQVIAPENYEMSKFCRKAMFGGRSQIFKRGFTNKVLQCKDVKSLYPFVMEKCAYPIGEEIATDKYIENKVGIYNCVIKSQPKINIIPNRIEDVSLDWSYDGEIECVLCSVDIECLKEFGSIVDIKDGIYWEESSNKVFTSYIKPLKDEKTKQDKLKDSNSKDYNPSMRAFSKLSLNALSGKVGQRIFTTRKQLVFNEKDVSNFVEKNDDVEIEIINNSEAMFLTGTKKEIYYKRNKAKPNFLCVFIYAYARSHMYKSVISKIDSRLAMDTDSLHAPEEIFTTLEQKPGFGNYNEGSEFGDFESELDFETKRSYYEAPKCYGLFGETKSKMRFKGIGKRDKLIEMSKEEFNKLSLQEKFELYQTLKPALSEQLYKSLSEDKEVTILCSQIKKLITIKNDDSSDYAKLQQVYMFKTIKPNNN